MKIKFENISKSFNGVSVLKDISFEIDGHIHALMGENGAGKSTLMKILTGVYEMDEGKIFVDGKQVKYDHPKSALKDGIVFIHQELNILGNMSVSDNIFLNQELVKNKIVDQKQMNEISHELLSRLGLDIDVSKKASSYSIGQQQIMEIAKALRQDAKLIIMDEPTAALSQRESQLFFKLINDLKNDGIHIIYISHRMEEVFDLSDKISVLRDGEYIETLDTVNTNNKEIVTLMVNREIEETNKSYDHVSKDVVLKVDNLNKTNQYSNISFELYEEEILGVAGLMGAGRSEIMHGIFKSDPPTSGDVYLNGNKLKNSIDDSIKNNLAFITEDRKSEGVVTNFTLKENLILTNLNHVSNNKVISNKKVNDLCDRFINSLNIKCSGSQQYLKNMSGGNQQKVVISKWLNTNPKVLIMDEPTRGIDINAKEEIYDITRTLCHQKKMSIILVSSELNEIIKMSDRVMVIHEGKIAGFLEREMITQENIMTLATGGSLNEN